MPLPPAVWINPPKDKGLNLSSSNPLSYSLISKRYCLTVFDNYRNYTDPLNLSHYAL